jgi:hypothetical protein
MTALRRRGASLDDPHERFRAAGQAEPPLCAFLAATGHPLAGAYLAARARFDALTWTCGYAQRLALYADEHNQIQLSAPALSISRDPQGWGGFGPVDLLEPGSWRPYAAAAAAARFPAPTRPNGHLGSWTILVREPEAAGRLRAALRRRGLDWRPVNGRAEYRMFTAARAGVVEAAIREALPAWELAPYSPPAPLAQAVSPAGSARASTAPAELTLFDTLFP